MHVGFLHDGEQRVLGPPARLEQRRKVGAGLHLRDRQFDRAHPRIPRARSAPVAIGYALARPLVALGPDQAGDLGFHQRLGEHSDPFPQHVPVLFFQELAYTRRQIHPCVGHRHRPPCVSFRQKELTERCTMALGAVYADGLTGFPPRPGTLTKLARQRAFFAVCRAGNSMLSRGPTESEESRSLVRTS